MPLRTILARLYSALCRSAVKLHVIADQHLVKTIECKNTMQPQTFTVPIYNCRQLTFWLEPGSTRSGQFVLYDMTVSKKPYKPAKE